jgi:predicted phage terminase large subunit-like protein
MDLVPFVQNKYIPITLEPKPLLFLSLPHRECLFGGAVGGGKSETLLAAALQYCHVPGYSAIIFRRSLAEHKMANNLIPRSKSWLGPFLKSGDVKWNAAEYEYSFKTTNWDGSEGTPATLKFGYCDQADSHLRYQGGEFHFCGWDEVTNIKHEMYEYLFSRLRKKVCHIHKLKNVWSDEHQCEITEPNYIEDCGWCNQAKSIPIRVRSATNPGGRSHGYFKDRFKLERDEGTGKFVGRNPDRPFIPSYVADNPYINQSEYLLSLAELDPVKREQLINGDWDASPDSLYRKEYCRYYSKRSDYIVFEGESYRPNELRWFFTMDCAGTRGEMQDGDSTVIGFWGLTKKFHLGLFDCIILREELPDIVDQAVKLYRKYHNLSPENFLVEKNGLGVGISQSMVARGLPVNTLHKSIDKVEFAQKGIIKMSQGRVFFPEENYPWKNKVEDQLFVWQGLKDEPDDIVDMVSMAAHYVDWSLFDATALENAVPKTKPKKKPSVLGGMSVVSNVDIEFPNYF